MPSVAVCKAQPFWGECFWQRQVRHWPEQTYNPPPTHTSCTLPCISTLPSDKGQAGCSSSGLAPNCPFAFTCP